ncbi:MAG TPA: hypothetical protein VF226_04780 [Hyphomicrobiaceae bacterium]
MASDPLSTRLLSGLSGPLEAGGNLLGAGLRGFENVADIAARPDFALFGAVRDILRLQNPVRGFIRGLAPRSDEDRANTFTLLRTVVPRGSFEEMALGTVLGLSPRAIDTAFRIAGFVGDIALSPTDAVTRLIRGARLVPRGIAAGTRAAEQAIRALSASDLGRRAVEAQTRLGELISGPARTGKEILRQHLSTRIRLPDGENIPVNVTAAEQEQAIREALIRETGLSVAERQRMAQRRMERVLEIPESLRSAEAALNVTVQNARSFLNFRRAQVIEQGSRLERRVQRVEKRFGVSRDRIFDLVEESGRDPAAIAQQPAEVQALVRDIRTLNKERLAREVAAGVPVRELGDILEYMAHLLTPEAKDAIQRQANFRPQSFAEWTVRNRHQLERQFRGKSVRQINELVRTQGLEIDGRLIRVDKFFEDDPVKVLVARGLAGERAIANAQFLDDMARLYGLPPSDPRAADWVSLDDIPQFGNLMKGLRFHPVIAREIVRIVERASPNAADQFAGLLRRYTQQWKVGTLAFRPAYHFRNVMGNLWNNWLAGVSDPQVYADAVRVLRDDAATVRIAGFDMPAAEIRRAAEERGVVRQGFYSIETQREFAQFANTSKRSIPAGTAFRLQQMYEDWSRLAHFIDRLKKGDTVDEAALSVKRYLFDYSDLTDTEKNILRPVFPFYSWWRKNIPLQLEKLIEEPHKFAVLEQARLAFERDRQTVPEPITPEFLRGVRGIEVAPGAFVRLAGNIPSAELAELSQPLRFLVSATHPLIQAPLQLVFGRTAFSGREISPTRIRPGLEPLTETEASLLDVVPGGVAVAEAFRVLREPTPVRAALRAIGVPIFEVDPGRQRGILRSQLMEERRRQLRAIQRAETEAERQRRRRILEDINRRLREVLGAGMTTPQSFIGSPSQ